MAFDNVWFTQGNFDNKNNIFQKPLQNEIKPQEPDKTAQKIVSNYENDKIFQEPVPTKNNSAEKEKKNLSHNKAVEKFKVLNVESHDSPEKKSDDKFNAESEINKFFENQQKINKERNNITEQNPQNIKNFDEIKENINDLNRNNNNLINLMNESSKIYCIPFVESEYINNNSPKQKKVLTENLLSIHSNINSNSNEKNINLLELDLQKKFPENEEKVQKTTDIIQNEVNNIDLFINNNEQTGNKTESDGQKSEKKEEKVN